MVSVDMATIRASDRKAGVRYVYLTPPAAQHLLLSFDQGWRQPTEEVIVKRAVKVYRSRAPRKKSPNEKIAARPGSLSWNTVEAGETLASKEKEMLTRAKKLQRKPPKARPTSKGKPGLALVVAPRVWSLVGLPFPGS